MSKIVITDENAAQFTADVLAKVNAAIAKEGLNVTLVGQVSESDEVGVIAKVLIQQGTETLEQRYWRQYHADYKLPADAMGKTVTIPTEGKSPSIDEYTIIGIGNSAKFPVMTTCKTDGQQYPMSADVIIEALVGGNPAKIAEVKAQIETIEAEAAKAAAEKEAKAKAKADKKNAEGTEATAEAAAEVKS